MRVDCPELTHSRSESQYGVVVMIVHVTPNKKSNP